MIAMINTIVEAGPVRIKRKKNYLKEKKKERLSKSNEGKKKG